MKDRIVTDAHGDRWDARESRDGEITFRHQTGRELSVDTERHLDELADDELLELLDRQTDAEPRTGPERSSDPDGYTTR